MKKILIVLFTLLLALSLVGCKTDSLEEYKSASEKTDQIKKGQTSGEFNLVVDFNTEEMTSEEIKKLNYYKDMKGSFNASFDEDLEKLICRNYINLGGLGFDFDLYFNKDEMFMKLPVVGKYMKLDEIKIYSNQDTKQDESPENIISAETIEAITTNWIALMKKEDVFKGNDIVLTTPDGEVKTTEYTIKLNDEQIKNLFINSVEIVSKDENFKEFYYTMQKNIDSLDTSFEEMTTNINEWINEYYVESFNYTAYVDIDGYIVNENIELILKVNNEVKGSLSAINYKLDIKNWDINKEQNFNFPILTDDNTLKIDSLDNMDNSETSLFENFFKNID